MAATAAQIAQLRRMVAEPTETTYDDEALAGYIEARPIRDELGNEPYVWDYTTMPPTRVANPEWIETYDLYAAATDIWDEKAAALVANFDATVDGASLHLSQQYQQAMAQAQAHRSRSTPAMVTVRRTDAY